MGNQPPTTAGNGPVSLTSVPSGDTTSSTTSGNNGLSTQLIIWGMVGFILVEVIAILCLLRYCCNARFRNKKKVKEFEIQAFKDLSKTPETYDVLDRGAVVSVNTDVVKTNGNGKKRLMTDEFDTLYNINETRFSGGSTSFAGSQRREPVETLEMLIDSGNKRISRKLLTNDNAEDIEEVIENEIIYKRTDSPLSVEQQVTYEYDGVVYNPIYAGITSISHAEMRPTTPVRFEEAREMKQQRRMDDSFGRNARVSSNGSYRRVQRARSYTREDTFTRRNKSLSYEIRDGEPVRWQYARDLITPDWEQLKASAADSMRGIRYANIIEPAYDVNPGNRYEEYHRRSAPPDRSYSPISFIDVKPVGTEASKGLYSQLPFGRMKRLTTFQNEPPKTQTQSVRYKVEEEEQRTIKKIIKDPDTDEILSVKSFIDFTSTIDVVPESDLARRLNKADDKISIRTATSSNTTSTNRHGVDARVTSALSSNRTAAENVSVINVDNQRKSSSSTNESGNSILAFPSPPLFGDERPRTPTFGSSNEKIIESSKQFLYSPSNLTEELQKSRDVQEITYNAKSLDTSDNMSLNLDRSRNQSIKSIASSNVAKQKPAAPPHPPPAPPVTSFLNEIRTFRQDSLKRAPENTSVVYSAPPPAPPPPPPVVPPFKFEAMETPRVLSSVMLPNQSGLPDNPPTERGDWSSVMKTFDENISGFTPKSMNNSLANLKAELEERRDEEDSETEIEGIIPFSEAQLF